MSVAQISRLTISGYAPASAVTAEAATRAAADAALQPLDSDLTAIAALSTTSFGRGLLALADAAAARTTLGLGTAATAAAGDFDASGAATAAQAASQPLDSDLTAIAALTTTSYGRAFLALADAAAGRTALGLGTAATQASTAFDAAGAAASAQSASQPLDSDLTAIAALSTTTFGRSLLAQADAAAVLATLGTDASSASRPPNGSAGGDLTGTYPNPTIKTALNDPAAATPGLRTLGTGATQAAAGNAAPTAHKTSHSTGGSDVLTPANIGAPAFVALSGDATPVVGVAFADAATGLNIAVTSGVAVRFQFMIAWLANAAATGGRFSLNGPSITRLAYSVRWNTTATAITQSPLGTSYDQAFTVGTASDATNNLAIIEGILVPGANGTLALRSAAELASPGSVTVKAGSSVMYW